MKKINYAKLFEKGYDLSIFLLVVTIPFGRTANSFSLFLLGVCWLGCLILNPKFKFRFSKVFLLFISLYLIQFLSLLYTTNKHIGLLNLEKYLPLLLLPIFLNHEYIRSKRCHRIFNLFIFSCLLSLLICILLSAYKNYEINNFKEFLPHLFLVNLTKNVGISHVYFGLYLSFSILILITSFFNKNSSLNKFFIWLFPCIAGALIVGAKMSIIALLVILILFALHYSIKSNNAAKGILITSLLLFLFGFSIFKIPFVRDRFSTLLDKRNYFVGDNYWNSIGTRVSLYYCSLDLLENNYLVGFGVGDVQKEIDNCLMEHKFTTLEGMSAHNQYIQYFLSAGLLGFLAFIFCLIIPFRRAFLSHNTIYMAFILLIVCASLTESILAVNKGIIFYSFFNSFLAFNINQIAAFPR